MSTAKTDDAGAPAPALKVGDWDVDPAGNQLRRDGEAMRLEPKAIEVLVYRLRKRLDGSGVRIVTLRGLGYVLEAD